MGLLPPTPLPPMQKRAAQHHFGPFGEGKATHQKKNTDPNRNSVHSLRKLIPPFSAYSKIGIPLTPDRPRIPIFWKRGFRGPKSPISPRPGKGSFLPKNPHFSAREHSDRKLPFPARVRPEGNGVFWTPKPSFPENGDSGPGESQF